MELPPKFLEASCRLILLLILLFDIQLLGACLIAWRLMLGLQFSAKVVWGFVADL